MSPQSAIAASLGTLLLGAMSPGPSFIVVAQAAISLSRRAGVATAVGMGVGGLAFTAVALLGLFALLTKVEWLYIAVKITGGIYLVYLGFKLWWHSSSPLSFDSHSTDSKASIYMAFRKGLATQLSNPKAALIYVSAFAAVLPQHPPTWCYAVLPSAVFGIDASWYATVAIMFSGRHVHKLYVKGKGALDRVAGTAIAMLGISLIETTNPVRTVLSELHRFWGS